jgi:hypothetical protein
MGTAEAERLSTLLEVRNYPWNANFDGAAVVRGCPEGQTIPRRTLTGGLRCSVLSPAGLNLKDCVTGLIGLK